MAYAGINFRETSGFISDGTGETYCIEDAYTGSVIRGGLTFGWTGLPPGNSRDRNAGIDRRLAGINYVSNGSAAVPFRVNLPDGAGTYDIWLSLGDNNAAHSYKCVVKDNSTTVATIGPTTTGSSDRYVDAVDTIRTSTTMPDFLNGGASEASGKITVSISSGILILDVGDPSGSDLTSITHLSWNKVGGGGSSTTLTADNGTFTHTGQDANLLFGRKLTADYGSFALSGQDVTLTKTTAYSISADYGSFSLAGQDVTFQKTDAGSYILTAEVGLFSLVGQGALASYSMNAESGNFVLAGQEVAFSLGVPAAYSLTVDAGSYSLTGQNARLDWSGAPIVPNRQAGIYMGMRIGL